eukprot:g18622.t1
MPVPQGGLEDVSSKLVQSTADLERSVQTVEERIQTVRGEMENSVADCLQRLVKEEQATQERDLRIAIRENLHRIESNTQLAANVYCRSVRWNCRGLKKRMADVLNQEREARVDCSGIRSPEFSLCSLPTMQLELCLAARSMAQEEGITAPLPVPGSCSLRLWVHPGVEMTFRLTVGEGENAVSRRFDYSFLEPSEVEGEPRTFFEVLNFCLLEQAGAAEESPESPELVPEDEAGTEGHEEERSERSKRSDEMFFTRSATAELVLHERLQKDLVSLRTRTPWTPQQPSETFGRGAGPDRGVSIRGVLWVGSQGRQFEHRFRNRGDVGGRAKFCSLEQLQDPQDGVLVAVDLNEVEQELPDHQQSLVLRDARNTAASGNGDVTSPMSPSWNLVTMPLATNTKATVRMKREDPSKTEQLVKCVSLPSLKASNMTQMNFTMRPSRRSHDF